MSEPFKFKQFTVHQDRCAMKVGTDGVLLGAVSSLRNHPISILDIGAGTGVISLILAQRSLAENIDAIEMDESAYEQCVENFENSPWADRLFCYHASFQEFHEEMDDSYDLIVSNPPFFMQSFSSGNLQRDKARQNIALPFESLFQGVQKLLTLKGVFSMIFPFSEENNILQLAKNTGLFPFEILRVRGNSRTALKRSVVQFSKSFCPLKEKELIIETERHQFTEEYVNLTKAFYLKM